MSTLVIHLDRSTDFLKPIYAPILNKTLATGGVTKHELRKLIEIHDGILMLGHATPRGLLSVGKFPESGFYIIDDSIAELLLQKNDNLYMVQH